MDINGMELKNRVKKLKKKFGKRALLILKLKIFGQDFFCFRYHGPRFKDIGGVYKADNGG